jgi:ubiquitin C-terminal hydrolase
MVADDDMTDMFVECLTCGGDGWWRCPACKEREEGAEAR